MFEVFIIDIGPLSLQAVGLITALASLFYELGVKGLLVETGPVVSRLFGLLT